MSNSVQQKAQNSSTTELNLEYAAAIMLRVFNAYDVDKSGTLQRREFRRLLRECGSNLTSKQCDTIINQMDADGDGLMNFGEFMSFLGRLYQLQFFGTDPETFWMKSQLQSDPPNSSSPRKVTHQPALPKSPNNFSSRQNERPAATIPSTQNLVNYREDRPPPLPPTRPKPQRSTPPPPFHPTARQPLSTVHPVARPLPPPPVPNPHKKL